MGGAVKVVKKVAKAVLSPVTKVLSIVGKAVEKVGQTVAKVVDGALKDPIGTIAKVAAVATGNAWALPLIDGASVVAKGGSFGDALKAAAISYATGKVATYAGNAVGAAAAKATGSSVAGQIIGAGAGASTVAIITGQDPIKAFATGGITAGVPAMLGKIDGFAALQKSSPNMANAIQGAVTAQLTGKNPTDALINGMIQASGIVTKAMQTFDPDGKLSPAETRVLSNVLMASTTAAVQGKDVSAAMAASFTQAGIKALGDMVASGFAKTGNSVLSASEALDKNAAAINKNIASQKSVAAQFDSVNDRLEADLDKQNSLYQTYTDAKSAFDKDNTNSTKQKTAQDALDAYNKFTTSFTKTYNDYYAPTLASYEKELSGLQTEYKTLSSKTETLNANLKTAIDNTSGSSAVAAQNATNKQFVMALDPKFDATAYAKLNGLSSTADVYEDYLSKGQFAGALTNYDAYVMQTLSKVDEFDKDYDKEAYNAAISAAMGAKDVATANAAVSKIAAQVDAAETTRTEAIKLLKDAYASAGVKDYQPSENEIASLMKMTDAQSYTTAIRTADIKTLTFDGAGYANQNDAATAAKTAGYNTYDWNGTTYTLQSSAETTAINNAREKLVTQVLAQQGKTIQSATDAQLKAAMDKVDAVPTKYLSSATLQDVVTGKYTSTSAAGIPTYEINGKPVFSNSSNAESVTKMLPDGYTLASVDDVWGDAHNPNAQLTILPDGTMAYVVPNQEIVVKGTKLPSAIESFGDVEDLAKSDPEAWLQLASKYEKDASGDLSDFFVNMANSAMLGAYATGNKDFGDNIKQTLSITTQAVGEQTANLAKFFASVTGASYDNALAKAGDALSKWGAANQSESTSKQEGNITAAVQNAKGVGDKIKAFISASFDNPGGFVTMVAKEGIQEILPMWAAKSVYNMGKVAYYSANAFANGMESWGSNAGDTYAAAIKQGLSDSDARAMASKVGLQSAMITFVTDGVGDIPMLKAIAGDVVKNSLSGAVKSGTLNGVTEYFDEMLQNAAQQYQLTGKVNWDQATTAGTIAMGIGAGVGSGLTLGVAINQNAVVAKDASGKNITLSEFLSGAKVANMSTFNINTQVGTAADGDAITLGSIVSMPMADGMNYDVVTAGAPSYVTNQNIVVGKDALGNNVTLSNLMSQVTADTSYDQVYKSLLNTTAEERTKAQTDFLTTTLKDLGYDPKAEDIEALISSNPGGSDVIAKAAATYADTHTVTYDEAKKMLTDAYTAQGFSKYVPTDAEIKQYMASGATVDPTAINKQVETYVGGNTVTSAEAEQIFKDTYGYQPSKEEIAQFTAVINQETQATNIGAYVDPLQVTYDEAKQYLLDNGYSASDEEINQFVAQINEQKQAENIAAWTDPRVVDEQEVRAALEAAGFHDATDAMVESLTGQYEEAKLQGMTKDALPGFIYEALKGQIGSLETGLETIGGQLTDLSADVKAKYDTLTQGQKDLADQLVQQGIDLETAIDTAVGNLQEDVNAKYETLTQGQKDLADQLVQQGVDLQTAIDTAIAGVQEDVQAKYDSLSQGQKDLADQLTQQGVDLNNAIDIASQQNQEQIQELNKNLQEQIGTEGRTATQEDIDALTQMLAGEQDVNQQYDVNQDNQITQEDLDILSQIVSGQKTDWNAPAGSVWAPTGLRGQLYESEQQRQADAAATQAAINKASVTNQRTALAGNAINQLGSLIQNLPGAYEAAQTTYQPVYAGEYGDYFNLGASPLDYGYSLSSPSQNKAQTTKIATGGYLDDLLKLLK